MKGHHIPHTEEAKQKIREKQQAWKKTQSYLDFCERQRQRAKKSPTQFQKGHKPYMDGKNLLIYQKGQDHWNWKGGIYPETRKLRNSVRMKEWRQAVFARDNYTCQTCKKRGVYIEADHFPIPFTILFRDKNWKVMWDTNNGRTLCRKCHDQTKSYWKKYYENT